MTLPYAMPHARFVRREVHDTVSTNWAFGVIYFASSEGCTLYLLSLYIKIACALPSNQRCDPHFPLQDSTTHDNHHAFPLIAMDLTVTQDWTKARRERLTSPDHLSALDAIAMVLSGSQSPSAAAAVVTKAYASYVERPLKNSGSSRLGPFWGMLCDAVREFGSAHSRLLDLLHEISTHDANGSSAKDSFGVIYWRDLPGFPYALCDDAIRSSLLHRIPASANDNISDYFHPYDYSPGELDEFLAQTPHLLNGTRFAATLFDQGFHIPALNLPTQADYFLEDGIESSHNDNHFVKAQEWKVLVPVSATWIVIAGKTIYRMCLDGQDVRPNSRIERVWDKPRWELWKEQLQVFGNRHDFNEECRRYATQALVRMVEVENECQMQ
jgi:hypothetical protein